MAVIWWCSGRRRGPRAARRHAWLGEHPLLVFAGTFGLVNGMAYLARLAEAIPGSIRRSASSRWAPVASTSGTGSLAAEKGVLDRSLFLVGRAASGKRLFVAASGRHDPRSVYGPEIVWRDAVQNKFFDSLAAGKPVVNNFPGWQSKVAVDAGAGLILSQTDADGAAEQVVTCLAQPGMATARGPCGTPPGRPNISIAMCSPRGLPLCWTRQARVHCWRARRAPPREAHHGCRVRDAELAVAFAPVMLLVALSRCSS